MVLLSRSLLALGVLLLLLGGVVSDAAAHAALVRSDPPAGAVLPKAPATIRLWFSEPLEPRYTRAQVLDAAGQPVAGAGSAVAPEDDHQLVVTLHADLPDGGYTIAWRNLSAADGHTLEGYFGFHVGEGAPSGGAPATAASPSNDTARALTRALALIGLTALLAIAPVTLGVLDPTARAVPGLADRLAPRLRRFAVAAALLALLGSAAALAAQAATIAPEVALLNAVGETLTGTRYGQLWVVRLLGLVLVAAAVAVALWGRPSWRRAALILGTVIGLGVPVPFSLLSHAAAQPRGAGAAVAADALHLLSAAVWGGGLLLLATVFAPALRPFGDGSWREALRLAIPRFSVLGLGAWGILWLSGLYSAWLQVGSLDALTQTPYGQSLLLKGALLIPVLALAAWHLALGWRGIPGTRLRRVAATFALEALLVVAVLLVVGRLIGQEPAREVLASQHPPQLIVPLAFAGDDAMRQGRLAIAPGAAGVNTFTLEIDGAALPDGSEGVLRFDFAQDMGEQELTLPQIGSNRFTTVGPELALAGAWRLEVVVRKIGAFAWVTQTSLHIANTPPPATEVNPPPRFGPGGIAGMVGLAIGLTALTAGALARGALPGRRVRIAAVGVAALAAGTVMLVGSRLPGVASAPAVAQLTVATPAPAAASSPAMAEHEHMVLTPGAATPVTLPGPGTPVSQGDLVVIVSSEPAAPGPNDITVAVSNPDGTPLRDARVVVFAEMAGMGKADTGIPAHETKPGRYVAMDVPLSMAGDWRLSIRISPKGQATQIVPIAVAVS